MHLPITQYLAMQVSGIGMVSSVSTYQILKQYTKRNDATMSTARDADTAADKDASPVAAPSDQVTLSAAARDKLRLSGAMKSYYEQAQETKKAKARERMAEIKKRIDELKAILLQFGAMAPKALLRELKQLAGELKGVAKDLQEGGGAGNTVIAAASGAQAPAESAHVADAEADEAGQEQYAEPASTGGADLENTDDAVSAEAADNLDNAESDEALEDEAVVSSTLEAERQQQLQQAQKEDDKRELQKTLAALKSLVNMFKAMLRAEDKDKETDQQFKDIDKLLKDVQESNINVSVDVPVA